MQRFNDAVDLPWDLSLGIFLRKHNVTPGLQEFMNFPWRDPLPDNLFACGTEVLASILGPVSHE